ncbi:dTDP-4-dehydrorhamnose reductase [Gilliamella sp. Pas-s25]|uniref:dTDP-4-dehydrorhamnose reductase n=1 Tax=Gilliamella sp. Pas-s25 TaxID=2687310 RepID=UPI00135D4E89|nr:dTDP-4-dehydrorhamnose reductase [Gilliamella sp. Pas-s25]MWP62870.1 dTDP-4-dehydrorhamnose reductase [Gilliamella sp. Pas-s25]
MKVLLIGANGQLGHCFQDICPKSWTLLVTNSQKLDITDSLAVDNYVSIYRPDVIVNAAAFTAVDKAEDEYELAYQVNAIGPKNLAMVSQKYNAKLVHVSTDYVFDGTKNQPYVESDKTNPINVYGKTKRKGELAVLENAPSAMIIRTSWVFSEYGNNFVKTMLKLASEKSELSVVDDQIGNPTYAGDIAKVIIKLLERNADGGIYHYCGDKSTSWFLFTKEILDIALEQKLLVQAPNVFPINTQSFPTKAKRPLYSVMSMDKLKKYCLSGSNWREKLISCISKIKSI